MLASGAWTGNSNASRSGPRHGFERLDRDGSVDRYSASLRMRCSVMKASTAAERGTEVLGADADVGLARG